MNALGIYFGPHVITIVETKGSKLINNIWISYPAISINESLDEKVPRDVKIITLIKDELNKYKIEAKEAAVCLSGKDLIIRTFDMPILPTNELLSAVNFEAKKYIPFKIEDLVSDFQWVADKSIQKEHILFAAIKKETLDRYQSILKQLGFKINSIEYSAFSVLRLFKLSALADKGIVAVVNSDLAEDDEINFVVLENGFPLFSRDITFVGAEAEVSKIEKTPSGINLEKLKREIRISLDYYRRKFPLKSIKKIYFISAEDYHSDLEGFIKETGLSAQFIDVSSYTGRPVNFSLSFIKGYSASLYKTIKTLLTINLLIPKIRAGSFKEIGKRPQKSFLYLALRGNLWVVILGALLCVAIFLFGAYQKQPLEKELKELSAGRLKLSTINPNASSEELSNIYSQYKEKVNILDNFVKRRLYLASLLDSLPRIAPEGLWLRNLSFKGEEGKKIEFVLEGSAYLGDNNKELELINGFLSDLKENAVFNRYFKEINLVSLDSEQGKEDKYTVTNFIISCIAY